MQSNEPSRREGKRGRSRRRWVLGTVVVLGVLLALLGVGFAMLTRVTGSTPAAVKVVKMTVRYTHDQVVQAPPFGGKPVVHILLLGTDVSFGGCSRTDTIKLITVAVKQRRITMLSIPRDTWVTLPNGRQGRINAAYAMGRRSSYRGTMYARATVQRLVTQLAGAPVHIDYYLRAQTDRAAALIDALGGIDLDIEKTMNYDDPSQGLHIHLTPGRHHLNGTQAIGYARFRHDAESDFGRMRRQDQLIRALLAALNDPRKSHRLAVIAPLLRFIVTDMSVYDVLALKRIAGSSGLAGIYTAELPSAPGRKGSASVVEIDDHRAAGLVVRDVLYGPRPTVLLLSGGRRLSAVSAARARLSSTVYNVVGVGATKTPVTATVIYTSARNRNTAKTLAAKLGLHAVIASSPPPPARIKREPYADSPAQITVVLGGGREREQGRRGEREHA